jgi:predicted Zn-dependent protease with MMP-like domain
MKWEALLRIVQEERDRILRTLPDPVREKARNLPVLCERVPSLATLETGIDPDTLGLFEGDSLRDEPSCPPVPPRMTLYLENLLAEAEHRPDVFREEVRITLLHELGHYLGFEESDLIERDLD